MRDLQLYANMCEEMLDSLSIPYNKNTTFCVNTRAKKRWGLCSQRGINYTISINVNLLNEENDESGLMNTIIHELLHTCPYCMKHTGMWLHYATLVNNKYHLNIKRCSSAEEKGITNTDMLPTVAKYIVRCDVCGHEFVRERCTKLIQYPQYYRCHCGGHLTRIK